MRFIFSTTALMAICCACLPAHAIGTGAGFATGLALGSVTRGSPGIQVAQPSPEAPSPTLAIRPAGACLWQMPGLMGWVNLHAINYMVASLNEGKAALTIYGPLPRPLALQTTSMDEVTKMTTGIEARLKECNR